MRSLHLFAGAGGGLLADLILGHTPIAAVEWDAYCCQVLRERAPEWFPELRVHEGDIRMFDASEYAGRVDCIHAGFPCTDLSLAGNRAGLGEGTRSGLYREVLRIAGVVRPRLLFLENVSAILSGGLGTVLGDLASRGYDCRWTCLPASAAGAPHFRDRWWCLAEDVAHPESIRYREGREVRDLSITHGRPNGCMCPISSGSSQQPENMADSPGQRCPQAGSHRCEQSEERVSGGGETLAHSHSIDGERGEPGCNDAHEREIQGRRPAGLCGCGEGCGRSSSATQSPIRGMADELAAQLDEKVGWWEVEPEVGRVCRQIPNRPSRLQALGNGQVPIQGALAWIMMGGPT